jgi:RimJ/RimL family protein N-acetyltransferase
MVLSQRALLRLHIEAVWGVRLPPIIQNNVGLHVEGPQPPWKLCAAEMDDDRVNIWRPDVLITERDGLRARANAALTLPLTEKAAPGISREAALHQITLPTISVTEARALARPLTSHDRALVEGWQPGSVEYYFHPNRHPLIGVVVAGRLLSLAHSARRTAEACELGIETVQEARRKGYALAATVLWAAQVAQEGRVPLYSALADNTASLGLAATAGYKVFARAVTIEE